MLGPSTRKEKLDTASTVLVALYLYFNAQLVTQLFDRVIHYLDLDQLDLKNLSLKAAAHEHTSLWGLIPGFRHSGLKSKSGQSARNTLADLQETEGHTHTAAAGTSGTRSTRCSRTD